MVKCSKALKNDHRHIRHLTLLHKSTLITGIYHVRNTWNYYAKFRPCVMLIINSILVLFPQMFDTFVSDRWAFPCCREKTHLTLHADITHFAPLQRKTNHSNTLNQMFFCTLIALRCQRYLGLPPVFRSVLLFMLSMKVLKQHLKSFNRCTCISIFCPASRVCLLVF